LCIFRKAFWRKFGSSVIISFGKVVMNLKGHTRLGGRSMAIPKELEGWGLKHIHLFGQSLVAKSLWIVLTKDSLWSRILVQKDIAPDSLVEYIRKEHKSIQNVSNQWKALSLAFLVIGSYLAWHVGDGTQVRIKVDAIMGCNRNVFLPRALVHHLQEVGRTTLNLINKPLETTLWKQGWLSSIDLGLGW
jgi:hypothetical protein